MIQTIDEQFHFDLISPNEVVLSCKARLVNIPGCDGMFGVKKNHTYFMSHLKAGLVQVETSKGEVKEYFVAGGLSDVRDNVASILAETILPLKTLSRERLDEEIGKAKKMGDKDLQNALEALEIEN